MLLFFRDDHLKLEHLFLRFTCDHEFRTIFVVVHLICLVYMLYKSSHRIVDFRNMSEV